MPHPRTALVLLALPSGAWADEVWIEDDTRNALCAARVILVGELHGAVNAPTALRRLVEALADCPGTTAVGFELREEAVRDLPAPQEARPGAAHWADTTPDGRSSGAMLEAVRWALGRPECRAMGRACTLAVDVRVPGAPSRDAAMAATIEAHLAEVSRVVVLIGNYHVRDHAGSAGVLLEASLGDAVVVRLDTGFAAGRAWNCMRTPGQEPRCGVSAFGDRAADVHTVTLDDDRLRGWEGVVPSGTLVPAPPWWE